MITRSSLPLEGFKAPTVASILHMEGHYFSREACISFFSIMKNTEQYSGEVSGNTGCICGKNKTIVDANKTTTFCHHQEFKTGVGGDLLKKWLKLITNMPVKAGCQHLRCESLEMQCLERI